MAGKNYFEMIRDGILVDGSGGGDAPAPVLIAKSVTANGTYTASSDNADGYSSVTVNVPSDTPTLLTKSISANGIYSASDDSADGYSSVSVSVPNTYGAGDEGKVVSNGTLVAQGSDSVTENGTVDTTLISSLLVNVQGGAGQALELTPASSNIDSSQTHFYIVEQTEYIYCFGAIYLSSSGLMTFQVPSSFDFAKMDSLNMGAVYSSYTGGASNARTDIFNLDQVNKTITFAVSRPSDIERNCCCILIINKSS